jgi:cysteine-rich repeat protein
MTTMNAHYELVIMNVKGNVMRLQRWMMCLVLACLSFAGSACFGPSFTDHPACGPNSECPLGTQCIGGTICVDNFCKTSDGDNLANGTQCANPGVPDGVCYNGDCKKVGCGDGQVVAPEVCDDGNQSDADGCSANCRSLETCGNNIVDLSTGEGCDTGTFGQSGDGCSSQCAVEIDNWTTIAPQPFDPRNSFAMAYDSSRHRTVLFGGRGEASGVFDDTWEFDGDFLLPNIVQTKPGSRFDAAMVFDSIRNRLVLFGGQGDGCFDANQGSSGCNDTWEFDGSLWRRIAVTQSPSSRSSSSLAFDSVRQKVVLFGGQGSASSAFELFDETWEYDGTTWLKRTPALKPPAREDSTMVYDSVRRKTVLFGGVTSSGYLGDTWEWDGTSWTQRTLAVAPPARQAASMTFDSTRSKVVLFGGFGQGVRSDTWEYDGGWKQLSPLQLPPARYRHKIAFDTARNKIVLVGGVNGEEEPFGDVWDLVCIDVDCNTRSWTVRNPPTKPPPRYGHAVAYDSFRGRAVMIGGVGTLNGTAGRFNDTWEFSDSRWRAQPTTVSPLKIDGHAMAFDSIRAKMVLFGGFSVVNGVFTAVAETWEYDGTNWQRIATIGSPSKRSGAMIAFDAVRSRIVLFGGFGGSSLDDTWEYDGVSWVEQQPSNHPPAFSGAAMVFDPIINRIVLTSAAETWTYDGTMWTKLMESATVPDPRERFAAAYVPSLRAMVITGGFSRLSSGDRKSDTWQLSSGIWSQRAVSTSLPPRGSPAIAFDAKAGRLVMFGGLGNGYLGDTWVYSFASSSPIETCDGVADSDGDGLRGCADPDCYGRCDPDCPPGATVCNPNRRRCGDGTCNAFLENHLLCDQDCP